MRRMREIIAAGADLGTVLPIVAALSVTTGLPASRALIALGAGFLLASCTYRLPIAVQPLKAVAAIVIAGGLPASVLPAVALWMGLIMIVLAVTGVGALLARLPLAFIRGNQLGVGVLLVMAAARMVGLLDGSPSTALTGGGIAVVVILIVSQLPLTLSNAIAGTASLATEAYGARARATTTRLLLTTGAMNLGAAAIGGIPLCHGSSGFTAYRTWGARTGLTTAIVGSTMLGVGLFAGGSADRLIGAVPVPFLAALLALTGVRHAMLMLDRRGTDLAVAVLIGIVGGWTQNLSIGVVVGLALVAIRATARTFSARQTVEPA